MTWGAGDRLHGRESQTRSVLEVHRLSGAVRRGTAADQDQDYHAAGLVLRLTAPHPLEAEEAVASFFEYFELDL